MQRHFPNSDAICEYVAAISPEVVLAFSNGKDSIAAWLQMRRFFPKIHLFYYYTIPGLEFVEEGLRYFEDFFETPIIRVPQPALYRMLNNFVFQPPERCHVIEAANYPTPSRETIIKSVIAELGLPRETFVGVGTRACDSIMRRRSVKKWGALNPNRRAFMPVFDWNAERVRESFREAKIRLPVDYEMFGRSFDGIDERFLRPIKERFPRDYARILDWFPLADLELQRSDWRKQHYA